MQNYVGKSTKNNISKTMETKRYKVIMVNTKNQSEKKEVYEIATSASMAAFGADMENPGYLSSEVILVEENQ